MLAKTYIPNTKQPSEKTANQCPTLESCCPDLTDNKKIPKKQEEKK